MGRSGVKCCCHGMRWLMDTWTHNNRGYLQHACKNEGSQKLQSHWFRDSQILSTDEKVLTTDGYWGGGSYYCVGLWPQAQYVVFALVGNLILMFMGSANLSLWVKTINYMNREWTWKSYVMGSLGKDGKGFWLSMFKHKMHCVYVWNFQRINRNFKKRNKSNSSKIYVREKKHYKQ